MIILLTAVLLSLISNTASAHKDTARVHKQVKDLPPIHAHTLSRGQLKAQQEAEGRAHTKKRRDEAEAIKRAERQAILDLYEAQQQELQEIAQKEEAQAPTVVPLEKASQSWDNLKIAEDTYNAEYAENISAGDVLRQEVKKEREGIYSRTPSANHSSRYSEAFSESKSAGPSRPSSTSPENSLFESGTYSDYLVSPRDGLASPGITPRKITPYAIGVAGVACYVVMKKMQESKGIEEEDVIACDQK